LQHAKAIETAMPLDIFMQLLTTTRLVTGVPSLWMALLIENFADVKIPLFWSMPQRHLLLPIGHTGYCA
jgi:hypothetical protein